eukprot:1450675-Rhodomonas_salina.2
MAMVEAKEADPGPDFHSRVFCRRLALICVRVLPVGLAASASFQEVLAILQQTETTKRRGALGRIMGLGVREKGTDWTDRWNRFGQGC